MTNEQIDELLAKICRTPLLAVGEERELLNAVKEKGSDCDEMKRLEQAHMCIVVCLMKQYLHRGLSLKELFQAGKAGLREAIEKYDMESGNKLAHEAVQCMRQHIECAIAKEIS